MFDLLGRILERLLQDANWLVLTKLLGLLHQVETRPDLSEPLRKRVKALIETPVQTANLDLIADTLNKSSEGKTEGFLAFLLQLNASAVPQLCQLLTILKHQQHRSLVGESLVMLAKNAPDPLAKYLNDLKLACVRDFVVVITRLRLARFAEHLQPLSRHEKSPVRKEAVRAFGILSPTGSGIPLLAFLQDPDGSIRFSTLSLLTSGQYTVPVTAWMPIVSDQAFHNRMTVEKRLVFLAMSQTSQAEAIPYFAGLVKQWLWFKPKQKQELALLAAETLGRVGSPEAVAVLEAGAKRRHKLIRNACKAALSNLSRTKTGHP
jgi:HEAT repeat protein